MLPFSRLFRRGSPPAVSRERIRLQPDDRTIYAIGDVHGCLAQLRALEAMIVEDAAELPDMPRMILMLGDLVDRGPQAAAVIDHVMGPAPAGFSRVVLTGNHEMEMLAAFADPDSGSGWLRLGGLETLRSYGVDLPGYPQSRREVRAAMLAAESVVPRQHIEFLRGLPVAALWRDFAFVHAGCVPGVDIAQQRDADLVTIREPFLGGWGESGTTVVHGHSPAAVAQSIGSRVEVDTACYATGRLSAARIGPDGVRFLSTAS